MSLCGSTYLLSWLFLCYCLLLYVSHVSSLPWFNLDEGARRCFIEEIPADMLIVGRYANLDWPLLRQSDAMNSIYIEVRDPQNNLIMEHDTIESGQIGFTSNVAGEHQICIIASTSTMYGQPKQFRFQMLLDQGEQAHDYASIAKAEHLSAIEVEVRKLNDKIRTIRNEIAYQKTREAEFRDTSESVNVSVVYWSIIQTVTLLGAGLTQLYLLTRFFKSKKLA